MININTIRNLMFKSRTKGGNESTMLDKSINVKQTYRQKQANGFLSKSYRVKISAIAFNMKRLRLNKIEVRTKHGTLKFELETELVDPNPILKL